MASDQNYFSIKKHFEPRIQGHVYIFNCDDGILVFSANDFTSTNQKTGALRFNMDKLTKKKFGMYVRVNKKTVLDFHQWMLTGIIPVSMGDQFHLLVFLSCIGYGDSSYESQIKTNFGFHPIENELNWFYIHETYSNGDAKGFYNLYCLIMRLIEDNFICILPGKEKKLNEQEIEKVRLDKEKQNEEAHIREEKNREEKTKKYHQERKRTSPPYYANHRNHK